MKLVEEVYKEVLCQPLAILDIFNEFFGEERVDMQGFKTLEEAKSHFAGVPEVSRATLQDYIGDRGFILVYFPEVTITNERDQSVNIRELWAKINILIDGRMEGRFLLNRSNYTLLHMMNGFLHSHVCSIPFNNFTDFQIPCTGSGPINHTIGSLNVGYDEDLWKLFCLELSRYVTVESLAGIPYHRLAELRTSNYSSISLYPCQTLSLSALSYESVAAFTAYLIKNVELPFTYQHKSYALALKPIDYVLKISDLFIRWYNSMYKKGAITYDLDILSRNGIIREVILSGDNLYTTQTFANRGYYAQYIGQKVCSFKGRDITVTISEVAEDEAIHSFYILNPSIIAYIITKILNVVNYKYGRDENQEGITSHEEVRYL